MNQWDFVSRFVSTAPVAPCVTFNASNRRWQIGSGTHKQQMPLGSEQPERCTFSADHETAHVGRPPKYNSPPANTEGAVPRDPACSTTRHQPDELVTLGLPARKG